MWHSLLWVNRPYGELAAYLRKNFNEHRFLHLPIHTKALKSLPWDICSLKIAVLFFTKMHAWLHVFPSQKVTDKLVSLLLIQTSFLRATERLSPGDFKLSETLNETNSQHLHCAFFFKSAVSYGSYSQGDCTVSDCTVSSTLNPKLFFFNV